jgi:hypothetical protein
MQQAAQLASWIQEEGQQWVVVGQSLLMSREAWTWVFTRRTSQVFKKQFNSTFNKEIGTLRVSILSASVEVYRQGLCPMLNEAQPVHTRRSSIDKQHR